MRVLVDCEEFNPKFNLFIENQLLPFYSMLQNP